MYLWGDFYNAQFSSKKTLVENTLSFRKKGKREMQIESSTYFKILILFYVNFNFLYLMDLSAILSLANFFYFH